MPKKQGISQDLIRNIVNEGYTRDEICAKIGCDIRTLYRILNKFNIDKRDIKRKEKSINPIAIKIVESFVSNPRSYKAISEDFNVKESYVMFFIRKYFRKPKKDLILKSKV